MIIIPAILESFKSLKDKTYKIVLQTNELKPEQMLKLAQYLQSFGFFAFKEDAFKSDEKNILEGLKSDYDDTSKTPSKRLRNTLYVMWQQNKEGFDTSQKHYDHYMEKFIDHVKGKLE